MPPELAQRAEALERKLCVSLGLIGRADHGLALRALQVIGLCRVLTTVGCPTWKAEEWALAEKTLADWEKLEVPHGG